MTAARPPCRYGDSVNAEESFDTISDYVEGVFAAQLEAETSSAQRDVEAMRHEDPLVHVSDVLCMRT